MSSFLCKFQHNCKSKGTNIPIKFTVFIIKAFNHRREEEPYTLKMEQHAASRLHGITFQKTVIITVTAMRISNPYNNYVISLSRIALLFGVSMKTKHFKIIGMSKTFVVYNYYVFRHYLSTSLTFSLKMEAARSSTIIGNHLLDYTFS
jgi:hypothetical protein